MSTTVKTRQLRASTALILTTAVLLGTQLVACNKSESTAKPSSDATANVSVATSTNPTSTNNYPTYNISVMNENPPYVLRDEKGVSTGLEVDILKAIGEKQKFNIQVNSQPWAKVFGTLDNKQADIVSSGLFITSERMQQYEVSRPYMQVQLGALVNKGSNINTIDDLKGHKVMGRTGSNVFEEVLKKQILKGDVTNTQGYDTTYLAVKALAKKDGDAVFAVKTTLNDIQKHLPQADNYQFIQYQQPNPPFVGFFAKKGNTDLINKINVGLDEISKDGTLDKIMLKWTGEHATALPTTDAVAATLTK